MLKEIQKSLDELNTRDKEKGNAQQEIISGETNQYTELLIQIKDLKEIQTSQLTWNVYFIISLIAILVIAYFIKLFKRFS